MYIGMWVHPRHLCLDVLERTLSDVVGFLGANSISVFINNMNFTKMNLILTYDNKSVGRESEAGKLYFEPRHDFYRATSIRPQRYKELLCFDLRHVISRAYSYGLEIVAHINCLNMTLNNMKYYMVDNVKEPINYGGAWVCPLNPEVRRYLLGLIEDLATREDIMEIELGEFWHPISPLMRNRITCFCKYCRIEAKSRNLNLSDVLSRISREHVMRKIQKIILHREDKEEPFEEAFTFRNYEKLKWLGKFGNIEDFFNFRTDIVTELLDDMTSIAHDYGVRVSTILPPPDISKALGIDYREIDRIVDLVKPVLFYKILGKDIRWFSKQCLRARRLLKSEGYPGVVALKNMGSNEIQKEVERALKVWRKGIMVYSYSLTSIDKMELIRECITSYGKIKRRFLF